MTAEQLFKAGKLDEAVQALNADLRNNPTDAKRRTFLFELLCFAGEYDRAEKQLEVLAQGGPPAQMGTLLYRSALHAERTRHDLFKKKEYPKKSLAAVSGTLNSKPFDTLTDADPRIGANLEIYAAGSYMWIPMSVVAAVEILPPKRLRDLLWAPTVVRPSDAYQGMELGEVLSPVLQPFSWQHADPDIRLGRATAWEEEDGEAVPIGQKILLVDGEEMPFLEIRKLEFSRDLGTASAAP